MILLLIIPLAYIAIGTYGAIALRWTQKTEGTDLLFDVVLWPILAYYYLTHGR